MFQHKKHFYIAGAIVSLMLVMVFPWLNARWPSQYLAKAAVTGIVSADIESVPTFGIYGLVVTLYNTAPATDALCQVDLDFFIPCYGGLSFPPNQGPPPTLFPAFVDYFDPSGTQKNVYLATHASEINSMFGSSFGTNQVLVVPLSGEGDYPNDPYGVDPGHNWPANPTATFVWNEINTDNYQGEWVTALNSIPRGMYIVGCGIDGAPACVPTPVCQANHICNPICEGIGYSNDGGPTCYSDIGCSDLCGAAPPEICDNQQDDDGDQLIDCDDPDCEQNPDCQGGGGEGPPDCAGLMVGLGEIVSGVDNQQTCESFAPLCAWADDACAIADYQAACNSVAPCAWVDGACANKEGEQITSCTDVSVGEHAEDVCKIIGLSGDSCAWDTSCKNAKDIENFCHSNYIVSCFDSLDQESCENSYSIAQGPSYSNCYWGTPAPSPTGCYFESPETCEACGNGFIDPGEECDDGNRVNRDGCSNACQIEDILPPDAISDLSADIWKSNTAILLAWTSPDPNDVGGGIVQTYLIRYSAAPITPENWVQATPVYAPACSDSGSETCHQTDLFGIGANGCWDIQIPEVCNVSSTYNICNIDGCDELYHNCSWLSDFGCVFNVASCEGGGAAGVSTDCIDVAPPGEAQTFIVQNVIPGTYYFAIRSSDNSGNLSAVSNVASITVQDLKPVVTGITPASGINSEAVGVMITGTNLLKPSDRQTAFGGQGTDFFSILLRSFGILDAVAAMPPNVVSMSTVTFISGAQTIRLWPVAGSSNYLVMNVPAGMPAGTYHVRVNSETNGVSDLSTATYTSLTDASHPMPSVTSVTPSAGPDNADVSVTIKGAHFTGASAVVLAISGNIAMPEYALENVRVVDDYTITAVVPAGGILGTYDVLVTTPYGTNAVSAAKFTISAVQSVTPATNVPVTVYQESVANMSGFSGQALQQSITLENTDTRIVNSNLAVGTMSVEIPAGTVVTDSDGHPYNGPIYPPRVVNKEEAIDSALYAQLNDEHSVIIEMGNPDERIEFDQDFVVTLEIIMSDAEATPVIWYYNRSEGTFELAGKNGEKDGVTYAPGGVVLGRVGNTYTMGVLTDHMSDYVLGVQPTVTNVTPDSGYLGTLIITGTNFHPNATVIIGGMALSATVHSTASISTAIPGFSAGTYMVTVTNPDLLSGNGFFTVTAPASQPQETYIGGGGGGSGSSGSGSTSEVFHFAAGKARLNLTNSSNMVTGLAVATLAAPVTKEKEINSAFVVAENLIQKSYGIMFAPLTFESGAITLKPNKNATISVHIPGDVTVSGDQNWDGRINPPLIQSEVMISNRGAPVRGSAFRLTRDNVEVIVKVGSDGSVLTFSHPVTLSVPVGLPDGATLQVYYSADGENWEVFNQGQAYAVQDGKISFATSHFTYFALVQEAGGVLRPAAPSPLGRVVGRAGFGDIENHWAKTFIERLVDLGVVNGKSAEAFAPDDMITRAELVKIAVKAFKIPVSTSTASRPFGDVEVSAWYAPYIEAAKDRGIVQGLANNAFMPNAPITRAEALKILLEAAGRKGLEDTGEFTFMDVPVGIWFAKYVGFAKDHGIIGGYANGAFYPGNPVTRAEVAKIVTKILEMK